MAFEIDKVALERELFGRFEESKRSEYPEVGPIGGDLFRSPGREGMPSVSGQVRRVPLGREKVAMETRVSNLEVMNRKLDWKMNRLGKEMKYLVDVVQTLSIKVTGGGVDV